MAVQKTNVLIGGEWYVLATVEGLTTAGATLEASAGAGRRWVAYAWGANNSASIANAFSFTKDSGALDGGVYNLPANGSEVRPFGVGYHVGPVDEEFGVDATANDINITVVYRSEPATEHTVT